MEDIISNLEMVLTAVYDNDGNNVLNKYIDCKSSLDLKEEKKETEESNDKNHKWNTSRIRSASLHLQSPFYIDSENGIEFKIELIKGEHQDETDIYIILKSMPVDMRQLSMRCDVKIEQKNISMTGVVHFRQNRLKSKMIQVAFNFADLEEVTFSINMNVIEQYQ